VDWQRKIVIAVFRRRVKQAAARAVEPAPAKIDPVRDGRPAGRRSGTPVEIRGNLSPGIYFSSIDCRGAITPIYARSAARIKNNDNPLALPAKSAPK
jgi:hypothetical protein